LLAVVVAAGVLPVLAPATTLAATGDWPQFRESQTHEAHNTGEHILSDVNASALGRAWTGATAGAINSSPAVANGVVYVGSADGKLYAFGVGCATGGGTCPPIWTGATGGPIDSSPSTSGNHVFVASTDGKLYAFAVGCATGGGSCAPLWTAATGGAIHSSPSIDNGVVYVGSSDGKLYAFDAAGSIGCSAGTCTPLWVGPTGGSVESSPAAANGVVYVGSDDGKLYAFAANCSSGGGTCTPLWTATTGGAVHSSPAVLTGVVYVGSLDGKLYAFDATGVTGCNAGVCTPIWTATTGGPIYSSPSVGDGRVWIGSDDGKVYSFRLTCNTGGGSCTPQWTGSTGGAVRSSPASANDVLYVGSADGKIYAFDADCATLVCQPLWSSQMGTVIQSSPAVTGSVVYAGSDNGNLYAFHLLVDHLVLSPATMSIAAGGNQDYSAEGFDSVNDDLGDFTSVTTFAISSGGTCTANQCGAASAGDYTVTGTYGPATGTAALHVTLTGSTFVPLTPTRLLDTRTGNGLSGAFTSQVPRTFAVAGRGGVPASAVAVTGNLTVVGQTAKGFLYMGPNVIANPTSSTLNFPVGDVRANAVTVALAPNGSLSVTYFSTTVTAQTQVVFDVTGYFVPDTTGATFVALTPTRLLDTRTGNGSPGAVTSQVPRPFAVAGRGGVPTNATAVTGNLTVTGQTAQGFLYLGPNQIANPTSSTLNFPLGDVRANAVTVALATDGSLSVTYFSTNRSARTQVVFDVTGYFVPGMSGATFVALTPTRLLDTRTGNGSPGAVTSQVPRPFAVAGRGGVPANSPAVTGNLTVTGQTAQGFLYLGPNLIVNPTSSTLNFPLGDVRANAVTVAVAPDGSLGVTYYSTNRSAQTQVVFDVTGYFVPAG
jgi:outer membrane protein assembly factor BamB